jgi:hypothetical protein
MGAITDEYMRKMLAKARPYTVVILHKSPLRDDPGADRVVWEHGRRNFELRRDRKLLIVCPMNDSSNVRGLCIFSTDPEETRKIMDDDPAIRAGIFTYEIHAAESFPGDSLSAGKSRHQKAP